MALLLNENIGVPGIIVRRIPARKCTVQELPGTEADAFIAAYHRQGVAGGKFKKAAQGLYFEGELIAVAQYCGPRTSAKKREYTTELLRLCFKDGVRVVGGASKLISYYKKVYKPCDLFTYQDSTGENSTVYEHCGFTLVSQSKEKVYLIAPGKTLGTASRKAREIYSLRAVVSFGPDALLGTSLGEVRDEATGRRLTNIELFESLGWHKESTSGDKVYAWFDPQRTFYTYKITASDSEKYYYGVHCLKQAQVPEEECLAEGYWGSGGRSTKKHSQVNKFNNWKLKHKDSLKKEIMGIFPHKAEAYAHEEALVGSKWQDDPLCLNSHRGGIVSGFTQGQATRFSEATCEVHGLTKFTGKSCLKCLSEKMYKPAFCPLHGETKHMGKKCRRCVSEASLTMKTCPVHGMSKHRGENCCKCQAEATVMLKECPLHGKTKHQGGTCCKCLYDKKSSLKDCEVHGQTEHLGRDCRKCLTFASIVYKECPKHGLTKYKGSTCLSCQNESLVTLEECPKHGLVKHKKGVCYRCLVGGMVHEEECPEHGLTKFLGSKCYKCREGNYALASCEVHGKTRHRAGVCLKCQAKKRVLKEKSCEECGKVFTPTSTKQKVCAGEHFRPCPLCGTPYLWRPRGRKTCSAECGRKALGLGPGGVEGLK